MDHLSACLFFSSIVLPLSALFLTHVFSSFFFFPLEILSGLARLCCSSFSGSPCSSGHHCSGHLCLRPWPHLSAAPRMGSDSRGTGSGGRSHRLMHVLFLSWHALSLSTFPSPSFDIVISFFCLPPTSIYIYSVTPP